MARKRLRPYQALDLDSLRRHQSDALVEAPTGSGKTLLAKTLVALEVGPGRRWSHAIIAVPQTVLEEGFASSQDTELIIDWPEGWATQVALAVPPLMIENARTSASTTRRIERYLASPGDGHAIVCTHATLNRVTLPADVRGMLLIVDEAHHSSAAKLGERVDQWSARGGALVFFDGYGSVGDDAVEPFARGLVGAVRRGIDRFGAFLLLWNSDLDAPRRHRVSSGAALRRHANLLARILKAGIGATNRELTSEMLLPVGAERAIDADFVGHIGAFGIYRGGTHRMANLRLVLM